MPRRGSGAKAAPPPPPERLNVFTPTCLEDLHWWMETDPRVAERILRLVEAARRDPFAGIGQPEPLRHVAPNTWSRRITGEHRLVYVARDRVTFVQARYQYWPELTTQRVTIRRVRPETDRFPCRRSPLDVCIG